MPSSAIDCPAVLLAFANHSDARLNMLAREKKTINHSLVDLESAGLIQLHCEDEASIDTLFDYLSKFRGRLCLFHYGGHANGGGLLLQGENGGELARGEGLADLLGREKALKLVFLNGCATRGQVQRLLAAGVPAVIATSVPVPDEWATGFAEQFYRDMGRGETIESAFATANAYLRTKDGSPYDASPDRGIGSVRPREAGLPALWGLYASAEEPARTAILGFRLPRPAPPPAPPTAAVEYREELNAGLRERLKTALIGVGKDVGSAIEAAEANDGDDGHGLAFAIVNAFPLPIGKQLLTLFAQETPDLTRLEQLVRTYETLMQLFAYAALAQLWEERARQPALAIPDEHRPVLNSFLTLSAGTAGRYDFYDLLVAVLGIFDGAGLQPFIRQSSRILTDLSDAPSRAAHDFLEDVRLRMTRGEIEASAVPALCATTAEHLGELVADLAFIVLYKHSTIRTIAVDKPPGDSARFVHRTVDLDGVQSAEQNRTFPTWTDSRAVILQHDRKDVQRYLSLTPLVIDENAFTGAPLPSLCFFSHFQDGLYAYRRIERAGDYILLPDPKRPELKPVAKAFDAFKRAVFG